MFYLIVNGKIVVDVDGEIVLFYSEIETEMFLDDMEIPLISVQVVKKEVVNE